MSQKLANDFKIHAWIYPSFMEKQRSSSGPCSSLTVSLSNPVSKTNIYSICKLKHTKLAFQPNVQIRHMMWILYLICLNTSEHGNVKYSLCFSRHLFYIDPKLMQAFLYRALIQDSDLSENMKIRTTVCLIGKQKIYNLNFSRVFTCSSQEF